MEPRILIQCASPFDDEASRLIGLLDDLQRSLYPPERCHMSPRRVLAEPDCLFLSGSLNGKIVGIGAVKICAPKNGTRYGEIKRVYILEEARGQGVGESLMAALEKHLYENEIFISRLASGIYQPAALRFYEKLAYEVCRPYDRYQPDDLIVFMEKKLTPETLAKAKAVPLS